MAVQTETTLSIMYGEDIADTVGLSNTLNTYLSEEIEDYIYCGCFNNVLAGNLFEYTTTAGSYDVWNKLNDKFMPYETDAVTGSYMEMLPGDGAYGVTEEKGRYVGTIWVTDIDNHGYDNNITQNNASHYKIITEWDARNYYVEHKGNFSQVDSYGATSWDDQNAGLYNYDFSNEELHYVYNDEGTKQDINLYGILSVFPYTVYVDSNSGLLYLVKMSTSLLGPGFRCHIAPNWNGGYSLLNFSGNNSAENSLSVTYNCLNFGSSFTDESGTSHNWLYSTSHVAYKYSRCDKKFKARTYFTVYEFQVAYFFEEAEELLWLFAAGGLKFKVNGTMYKPLISENVVYDYTDDMTSESEIDNYTGSNKHDIPVTPPTPPTPPGPYEDDPWHGVSFSGVGVGGAGAFAKCYYMTSTELANLRSWMNSNNVPEGFDPMQQIIGLSQVPVNLSGDDNTTVQFVNSSAVYDPGVTRLVDSGVSTQISMGTPKRYSLGSVNITRRMQERGEPYLDYDCQIELYLPLIGMFSLDTQAVMGRTITAEAVLDPISGTLAAYAYVTRDGQNLPIAYGSTTIGVDLPISAQQYSVARAALKQANAQLGTSLLSSTLSLIAAATAGGKGSGTGAKTATGSTNGLAAAGIREAGADYMKASQAGNVFGDFMQWGRTIRQLSYGNNTAIAGSFGGSTAQWSYPFTPYVKIIRPRYEKPRNYNRSHGVPCVQTKTVGSCTGFIQCIGVEVKGITGATDIELQAIQAALTNGVFAGGGS